MKGATRGKNRPRTAAEFQSTLPRRERRPADTWLPSRPRHDNPRSREGSDRRCRQGDTPPRHFNPRSREGSDASFCTLPRYFELFQSTLPRRERPCLHLFQVTNLRFQSTLPRRERPGVRFLIKDHNKFQSTLPRRERHCGSTVNSGTDVISIHAPVKGATGGRES